MSIHWFITFLLIKLFVQKFDFVHILCQILMFIHMLIGGTFTLFAVFVNVMVWIQVPIKFIRGMLLALVHVMDVPMLQVFLFFGYSLFLLVILAFTSQ